MLATAAAVHAACATAAAAAAAAADVFALFPPALRFRSDSPQRRSFDDCLGYQ